MQQKWLKCCICGAVTDFDESHCPIRCVDNGEMEIVLISPKEMRNLLSQKKIWTKWPDQLTPFLKISSL